MQYAIVILDGASGYPVQEFGDKTSLETSRTPYLDALAQQGMVGLMQNVPAHMQSGSDVACLSLLGYDPALYSLGRGAIEAASLGINLEPGQVALRLNLCYVEAHIMKGYSTDNISNEDGKALALELKEALDNETFTLYPATSFRQILVVDGYPDLMKLEYETPHDNSGVDITEASAPKAAAGVDQGLIDMLLDYMNAANEVLAHSAVNKRRIAEGKWPANFVWPFWPGMKPGSLQPFKQVYKKRAALNSGVDLLKGLALMTGITFYDFEGVTDGPTNDFEAQGKGGISMLEDGNDVVVIHVEAPDAAGHDGSLVDKKRSIEESDRFIIGPLCDYARTHALRIAVMPDHPTPLSTRKHSHDPVPFVLAGPGISSNKAVRFTEREADKTCFMLPDGHSFIKKLLLSE